MACMVDLPPESSLIGCHVVITWRASQAPSDHSHQDGFLGEGSLGPGGVADHAGVVPQLGDA